MKRITLELDFNELVALRYALIEGYDNAAFASLYNLADYVNNVVEQVNEYLTESELDEVETVLEKEVFDKKDLGVDNEWHRTKG